MDCITRAALAAASLDTIALGHLLDSERRDALDEVMPDVYRGEPEPDRSEEPESEWPPTR